MAEGKHMVLDHADLVLERRVSKDQSYYYTRDLNKYLVSLSNKELSNIFKVCMCI